MPGLVVDRFDEVLVAQISTAGMEQVRDDVVEALNQVLKPKGILFKNRGNSRKLEDLPQYVEMASGAVPEVVVLEENGVSFQAPVMEGQKTGWFYDHRLNRDRLRHYVKGKRVLDVFSMHLHRDNMIDLLRAGSRHIDRNLQILDQGHQGPDHPVHPCIAETDYIKAIFARLTVQ
nr:class I SAM-dependent methyltransferase [Endozoicomonas acroporae]